MSEFLTDHFEAQQKAYPAVKPYRSSLTSISPPEQGTLLREHPLNVRLCKEMFVTFPPHPKHSTIWDANVLLRCLELWHPVIDLLLKQ